MKADGLSKTILAHLAMLKTRPMMLIAARPGISYEVMATHLSGYLQGIDAVLGINTERSIVRWYEQADNDLISAAWSGYVRYKHKGKSDSELVAILLARMESFFLQNPDWHTESWQADNLVRAEAHRDRLLNDDEWLYGPDEPG